MSIDDNKIKESISNVLDDIKSMYGAPMPLEVKNPDEFLKHLQLKNHAIHKLKITIGDKKIDINKPYPVIKAELKRQNIDEFSAEGIRILDMKKKQLGVLMKANSAFRKAYGTIVTRTGEKVEFKNIFDPVKEELISLFGRMFSLKEVHEVCLKQWKLNVKLQAVQDFRTQNQVAINKLIEEHQRTYSDIRLGHKRSRLEELVWLYQKRKRIYETSQKADDHRLLLATLNQIKQEAEGDTIRIDGSIDININATIENHIQNNLMKTIGIKEIILGRVAAKIGIPVVRVIEGLNQGYYRKFIEADIQDIEHEEVVMPSYPSQQNYDFDRISRIQQQTEMNKAIEKEKDKIVDKAAVQAGLSLKELLAKKLAEKTGDVNYAKNTMNQYSKD